MSGLRLTLPTSFTDTTLPVLRDDEILTAGSLALVDPTHPASPWAAGLPADGASLPNIAWREGAAVIGGGLSQAAMAAKAEVASAFGGSGMLRERTPKGGYHVVAKVGAYTANRYCKLSLARGSAIETYLAANLGHSYFVSLWYKLTRTLAGSGFIPLSQYGYDTVNSLWFPGIRDSIGGENVYPTVNRINKRTYPTAGNKAVGDNMENAAWSAGAGTFAPSSVFYPTLAHWGDVYGAAGGTGASFTFYRFYLEDLTVSGRSYATVDAIDNTAYTREVLTAGGRYYGDTYTDPSTVA